MRANKVMRLLAAIMCTLFLLTACRSGNTVEGTSAENSQEGGIPLPKSSLEILMESLDENSPDYFEKLAAFAVNDLISNYWVGTPEKGSIIPTWTGVPLEEMPDERGGLWERGQMLFAMYDLYQVNKDEKLKNMIIREAKRFMEIYKPVELETAGPLLHTAADDCGWHAMLYLMFYEVSGEKWFVERAVNLLDDARRRWADDTMGGGLWYNDDKEWKSLYGVSLSLNWWRLWEITGDERFYKMAVDEYEWMHKALGREDGIYFTDISTAGPKGEFRPNDIHEAGSVSFLSGNMGMAAFSMKMYKHTGDAKYLERAKKTSEGLMKFYAKTGVYLNDRDAWTNGTFAAYFVSDVLSNAEFAEHKKVLAETAKSIMKNARTPDGYYGGCWSGPADGPQSPWSMIGSVPKQIMTSATGVQMVVAAAMLEKNITDYIR